MVAEKVMFSNIFVLLLAVNCYCVEDGLSKDDKTSDNLLSIDKASFILPVSYQMKLSRLQLICEKD